MDKALIVERENVEELNNKVIEEKEKEKEIEEIKNAMTKIKSTKEVSLRKNTMTKRLLENKMINAIVKDEEKDKEVLISTYVTTLDEDLFFFNNKENKVAIKNPDDFMKKIQDGVDLKKKDQRKRF